MKKIWVAFFVMTAGIANAASHSWHWAYLQNDLTSWNVRQGFADVDIQGNNFTAKLYENDDPHNPAILLKGTIKDGGIKVVKTEANSDWGDTTFAGTYLSTDLKDSFRNETINLSDGFSMIGLTCEYPK